jgi:hypothetical protein
MGHTIEPITTYCGYKCPSIHQSVRTDKEISWAKYLRIGAAEGRIQLVMKKYVSIFLSLLILAAVAVGACRAADALQYSLFTYQSPLLVVQVEPGEQVPPQTQRVVVVVVGGLGQAAAGSLAMPNLEAFIEAGASAPMFSQPPTLPLSAWTTLLTGAWPELNNAPILKAKTADHQQSIAFDHLFAAAHDAGLRTAITGYEGWKPLLPADTVDASIFTSEEDAIGDAQVAQAALEFIADPQYDLIWVYFSQVDAAGRAEGTGGAAYASAAQQVDNHLRQIIRSVDTSQSVLMITSDHGLTEDGHLGGSEPELTNLPFAMIGQNIISGVYSPMHQIDVAPTVTALLGIRLPAAAQGRPLYEMVGLKEEALTRGQLQLATQKVALGDAYLRLMGESGLSQAIHQDLESAQQTLLDGNQAGALELATLISKEVVAEMASAKAARIAGGRAPRLLVTTVGLCLALLFFWGRRGSHTLVSIIGGGVAVTTYHILYRLGGYTFSLSAIDTIDAFVSTLIRYAVVGVMGGGLVLLIGLIYQDERHWSAAIKTGYDYGLYAVFLAVLPAVVGFWQYGATIRWYLPDLKFTILQFAALVQVTIVALVAIPLPWIIAPLVWGVGRWRTYSEARAQAWDSMARLRRR